VRRRNQSARVALQRLQWQPFVRDTEQRDECSWDEPFAWLNPYEWEDHYLPKTGCGSHNINTNVKYTPPEIEEYIDYDDPKYHFQSFAEYITWLKESELKELNYRNGKITP
jgi:hypothetical protein